MEVVVEEEEKEIDLPKPGKLAKQIEESQSSRLKYARIWDMCSLFLQGKQHLQWDRTVSGFTGTRSAPGKQKVTINLILNIYRNMLAKLSMGYPSVTVMPSSPSTEDIAKAQASELALKYYWSAEDMKMTLMRAAEWLLVTGNVLLHSYYDPDENSIKTDVVSPYDVIFEPGVDLESESEWTAIRHRVIRQDLEEAYPDYKEEIGRFNDSDPGKYEPLRPLTTGSDTKEPENRVTVYEIYTRKGLTGMLMGSTWIYKGECAEGISPLQFIRYTHVPGRLWGMGLIEPLIELQTLYNRGRAQVAENAELMGNPKWIIPKTAGLSKGALSDSRPGEKVMYNANAGPPPTQIAAAPLPGYILDNVRQLSAEMLDIAGVHSTSLGKRAIGIESGAAIEALSGKDMTQLHVTQSQIEDGVRDLAKTLLVLMQAHYTEPKMMKILDEAGRVAFNEIKATNLVSDPEIYIEAGSMFRDEKQDKEQRIMEMLKLGLLDKETALQELHFRTGNAFLTKKMQAISHAHDMLDAVLKNAAIEILPTDDLEAFQEVFKEFMQTDDYYSLDNERQDYVRDVLVSVATFGKENEEQQRALLERTVFPRVEPLAASAKQHVLSLGSPVAQAQAESAHGEMAQRRALFDGEPNPEQGIGRTRMGGGG